MIDRNDMLELTRRLTPARSSVDRIAGAWFDEEGYVEGTFNKNILHLKPSELKKNLELAKTVLFSKTNDQLKDYRISASSRGQSIFRMRYTARVAEAASATAGSSGAGAAWS